MPTMKATILLAALALAACGEIKGDPRGGMPYQGAQSAEHLYANCMAHPDLAGKLMISEVCGCIARRLSSDAQLRTMATADQIGKRGGMKGSPSRTVGTECLREVGVSFTDD